jgi:hypothetical protein
MGERWRTADGWAVEIVTLAITPNHHDGTWIRVRQHGAWVADVRSVTELATLVPLAELEPEPPAGLGADVGHPRVAPYPCGPQAPDVLGLAEVGASAVSAHGFAEAPRRGGVMLVLAAAWR